VSSIKKKFGVFCGGTEKKPVEPDQDNACEGKLKKKKMLR